MQAQGHSQADSEPFTIITNTLIRKFFWSAVA